jgi:hypothetical protein
MFLRCVLKISCPQVWTQVQSYINVHGVLNGRPANAHNFDALGGANAEVGVANFRGDYVPSLCFAEGDALTGCCSSINFLFNGTSLGLNRTNRWFRDFTKCMLSSDDAAKIYKSSGGRFDQKDQRGVGGIVSELLLTDAGVHANDANADEVGARSFAGITQDSGISDRTKSLFSLLRDGQGTVPGGNTFSRYLQVSWPVCVSPFNPWRGVPVPASCPYRKGPLAIPHLSAGGLDLLMEDFQKTFIRRLGRTSAIVTDGAGHYSANNSNAAVVVELVKTETPYLEIKYFRLSHTRTLKESYRWNCWQAQTFQGPTPPNAEGDGYGVTKDAMICMAPIGKDIVDSNGAGIQLIKADRADKEHSIVFDVINLAQIPSYLLISVPKVADCFGLTAEPADALNCMKNLDNNLSIKTLKIIVNSARGAIDPSADSTGFTDAERLWEMTKENANSEYFKDGGFRQWRDYSSCVLLSSSQFAPGLQACDGVAYPVQIQVEMTVQNRAVDVTALGISNGNVKARANVRAHGLSYDFIRARAQVTALFNKLILSTSETSASTNYMSYPLDSSERLMNNAGAMR